MATAQTSSTETLFHQWRKGDAAAGQAMAQRFTDWYFAIAANRLSEPQGDAAFREACTHFSRGVGKVADARRLLGWAHSIARKEIHGAAPGGRLSDGDIPNAFTRNAAPKELLARVRAQLPSEMNVLEHAYRGQPVTDPIGLLRARYRVKSWLASTFEIPFRVLRTEPDPDLAPLPLYEAGLLANDTEDTHFELFMLHDMEVCQDVAEFAHFAIALRGGIAGTIPEAAPQQTPRPEAKVGPTASPAAGQAQVASSSSNDDHRPPAPPTGGGPSKVTLAAGVILGLVVVLILGILALNYAV